MILYIASIGGTKVRKQILMSVRDFYNAVTPGSSLSHGVGRGVYTVVEPKELRTAKMYELEKLPTERRNEISVLNEVIIIFKKIRTILSIKNFLFHCIQNYFRFKKKEC